MSETERVTLKVNLILNGEMLRMGAVMPLARLPDWTRKHKYIARVKNHTLPLSPIGRKSLRIWSAIALVPPPRPHRTARR
jgi:hypothetical protein